MLMLYYCPDFFNTWASWLFKYYKYVLDFGKWISWVQLPSKLCFIWPEIFNVGAYGRKLIEMLNSLRSTVHNILRIGTDTTQCWKCYGQNKAPLLNEKFSAATLDMFTSVKTWLTNISLRKFRGWKTLGLCLTYKMRNLKHDTCNR